jgi:hypothetical protein
MVKFMNFFIVFIIVAGILGLSAIIATEITKPNYM